MNKRSKKINLEMKLGLVLLSLYFLWALTWLINSHFVQGTYQSPYIPEVNLSHELLPPFSKGFFLGADLLGRSMIEVLSAGLAYSLGLATLVTLATSGLGIIIGFFSVVSSYKLRLFADLIINLMFVFPSILIAIMVMAVSGQSLRGLFFAMIITGWPGYAKIARGEIKRIMTLNYVEGAKALGMGRVRMFFRLIIPALIPLMLVNMILGMSGVIISEAALGFLGLGASPYSWGALLSSAKTVLLEAPHVTIILSLCMAGLIVGLNLLGDGLRDYLDPKEVSSGE